MVSEAGAFMVGGGLVLYIIFSRAGQAICYAVRIAVDHCLPEVKLVRGSRKSQTARGYGSCGDKRLSRNVMERGT